MVASLRQLISPDNLTKEDVRTAVILGWCVEWVSKMSKLIGLIFFFFSVIKSPGLGISHSYYECGLRLLSLENRRKIEPMLAV